VCTALLAIFFIGCAGIPQEKDDSVWHYPDDIPHFESDTPVKVTARVDAFHYQGAFIDFADNFVIFHSVDFLVESPAEFAFSKMSMNFQGPAIANGTHIELGDTVEFTAPRIRRDDNDHGDCCPPYLKDLSDLVVLRHE